MKQFFSDITNPAVKMSNFQIKLGNEGLHVQFMRCLQPTKNIIIRFHGAIQRQVRTLPAFQANLSEMSNFAHQITICDPTMMSRDGYSLSWYAGHETFDCQSLLLEFFQKLTDALQIERTIYLGSSGGGFASLFYSHHHKGSVAMVMVPQTNLQGHAKASLSDYLENCWPGHTLEDVSNHICTDVGALYSEGFDNSIIYVQSAGDHYHLCNQMQPFLKSVYQSADDAGERFILCCGFWGKLGHGGVVPHKAYIPWLKAALSSPSIAADDILMTYSSIEPNSSTGVSTRATSKSDPDPIDIRKSDLLLKLALQS